MAHQKIERQTLTVKEAATLLGTSTRVVRKHVVSGKLPGTAVEGEGNELIYIIPKAAVTRFLETGRVTQEEPGTPATE